MLIVNDKSELYFVIKIIDIDFYLFFFFMKCLIMIKDIDFDKKKE